MPWCEGTVLESIQRKTSAKLRCSGARSHICEPCADLFGCVCRRPQTPYTVESASYCADRKRWAAGGDDMWVHLYDYDTGAELDTNKGEKLHRVVRHSEITKIHGSYCQHLFICSQTTPCAGGQDTHRGCVYGDVTSIG